MDLHSRLLERITEDSDGCEDTSAEALVDALRAVVELHRPLGWDDDLPEEISDWAVIGDPDECSWPAPKLRCAACSRVHRHALLRVPYPCNESKVIASKLGIEVEP